MSIFVKCMKNKKRMQQKQQEETQRLDKERIEETNKKIKTVLDVLGVEITLNEAMMILSLASKQLNQRASKLTISEIPKE